jgi:uncharacterized membrane protein
MYLRVLLTLHISCGVVGFVCAPVALAKAKGGKVHRRFGKIYFWAMAGVAVTALILSVALPVYFLTMVAVFSFYSAFAAYRVPRPSSIQVGFQTISLAFYIPGEHGRVLRLQQLSATF